MEAMLATGLVEAAAIADPSHDMREEASRIAPGAAMLETLDELLTQDLDGLVIASPSALHAEQSVRALEEGLAVFCQKPLGRTAAETARVVEAARAADRLLGVDLSYRETSGMQAIRRAIAAGELGRVFAADLTFHNAYGPGKPWFFDPRQSGGGCVIDLGVHLVDLALWALGWPHVETVESQLFGKGLPLADPSREVEDYALATLRLDSGAAVRLACSWNLPAGTEAVIGAEFYGTAGAAALRNVGGSFYDLAATRMIGTASHELAPLDSDWGGRAAAEWARRLASGEGFDPEAERLVDVARVLDRIYQR
jgi:predicted dehydrogenase